VVRSLLVWPFPMSKPENPARCIVHDGAARECRARRDWQTSQAAMFAVRETAIPESRYRKLPTC
jgi:hypothetical protein